MGSHLPHHKQTRTAHAAPRLSLALSLLWAHGCLFVLILMPHVLSTCSLFFLQTLLCSRPLTAATVPCQIRKVRVVQ